MSEKRDKLAMRIEAHQNEAESIRRELNTEGRAVLSQLLLSMSLREVGRRVGLSPTYLSLVGSGDKGISPGAFIQLHELTRKVRP